MPRTTQLSDSLGVKSTVVVSATDGCKIAYGATALDGSNPTPVATGLTTVVSFVCSLLDTNGLGSGTAFVTSGAPVAGAVDVYGWIVAGTASTGTETFNWIAIGT